MKPILYIASAIIGLTVVGYAAPAVPSGWTIAQKDESPIILVALHRNNGGITMFEESKSDFQASTLEDYLSTKVENLNVEFGIRERTPNKSETIGNGIAASSASCRVGTPDEKGVKVDLRYRIYVYEEGDKFVTIFLMCRVGHEANYYPPFSEFLHKLRLK